MDRPSRIVSSREQDRATWTAALGAEATGLDFGSGLRELGRKAGTVPVLLCLYTYGIATKYGMAGTLRHRVETITGALEILCGFGLVASEKQACFPFREAFWLTPRGRELVETPLPQWPDLLSSLLD